MNIIERLKECHLTISTAESITGVNFDAFNLSVCPRMLPDAWPPRLKYTWLVILISVFASLVAW